MKFILTMIYLWDCIFFFFCSNVQDEYTLYISCFKVVSLNYDSKKNGGHIITLVTKNKKHVDGLRYSVWVNSIAIYTVWEQHL